MITMESASDENSRIAVTKSIAAQYGVEFTDEEYRKIALQCKNSWYVSNAIKNKILAKNAERNI